MGPLFCRCDRSKDSCAPSSTVPLIPKGTLIQIMAEAGYALAREHSFLPKQYFLEFIPAP